MKGKFMNFFYLYLTFDGGFKVLTKKPSTERNAKNFENL